ncbi:MAG: hypothetical protein AAB617_02040 [Patescibacteria group bacterium]
MTIGARAVLPDYTRRFFPISEDLGVSLGMVFFGEEALRMVAQKTVAGINPGDPIFRHHSLSDAHRLYFKSNHNDSLVDSFGSVFFSCGETLSELKSLGIAPPCFEWTLFRLPGVKAFCMRESEKVKFGFGRPHPFRENFRAHPALAGPLVDYIPGTHPKEWGEQWGFEPVWLRVVGFSGEEYFLKLHSDWASGDDLVVFRVERFGPTDSDLSQVAPSALLAAQI